MTAFPTSSRSASSTSCSSPGTHFDFVIIRINRSTQGEIASILLGMHQQMFNLREGDSFPATRRRELALRLRSSRMATLCPKSLVSSIKVEVKKKHNSVGRKFSCFSAHLIERDLF